MRFRNNHLNLLRIRLFIFCLIIFGLVARNVLHGKSPLQGTQEKPIVAVQDKPAIEIIPASDIVLQAQRVSADLTQIRTLLHPVPVVEKIETDLPLFIGFGESSLDFEVRISIKEYLDWIRIRSEVYLAIHAALEAAGIEIPFPQRDFHLRSVDPKLKDHLKND